MSLNPTGTANYNWNYNKPDKSGYSLELWGTVVSLQEVQAREYNPNSPMPGRPRTWPDGNPVMNIRIGFASPDGTLKSLTFGKAGKKQRSGEKPSVHMQLFNLTNGNMMELIGKTLHIWTWPADPESGQVWGPGNPRKFGVEERTDGIKYELAYPLPEEYKVPELYCNDGAQGGQPIQQQQQQQPPMYGQFYAPPTQQFPQPPQYQQYVPQQQPQYQAQYQPQPMMQQPVPPAPQQMQPPMMQQSPAMQAMPPQQMTAQMPQGMDPAVAQAMQAVGAVNVQPVDDVVPVEVYDDIPFD